MLSKSSAFRPNWPVAGWLALITLLGLGLRLLAWHWREFYPLGGDEQEYFQQAVILLRDRQYTELRFMRPPIYPLFLAISIQFVDSLVQNLRLVQALVSTATIPLIYLLTRELTLWRDTNVHWPALIAALITALSYTLAANATELLTEALFLFGLSAFFWLLLRAARTTSWRIAALAGLTLGLLCLVRSVGLPLLPLGALWLLIISAKLPWPRRGWLSAAFVAATLIVILPWSIRNTLTYGGFILIDTTGAENLWLDNDPAGREAVKAELYGMGDERLARQQLSTERGIAVITANPGRFLNKAWGELLKFFALEFSDDMRNRPAIWVPPAEVWLRLLLGDALWLTMLLGGSYGLLRYTLSGGPTRNLLALFSNPGWLFLPWALYVLLTTLIFHVELRYRLPLYPALLPFVGLLGQLLGKRPGEAARASSTLPMIAFRLVPWLCAGLCLLITFRHAPYPALAWQLANKHIALAQAESALSGGDAAAATLAAQRALHADEESALAHVALARAALLNDDIATAQAELSSAIDLLPAHPYAHLLLGDLLRSQGDMETAIGELRYESNSLENLQAWSWQRFRSPAQSSLALGEGLDLGFIDGFHLAQESEPGLRWTTQRAELRLAVPQGASSIQFQLASGRPDGASVNVRIRINQQDLGKLQVSSDMSDYSLPLPPELASQPELRIEISSPTFTPRSYDPSSPDGRTLGVMVRRVALR